MKIKKSLLAITLVSVLIASVFLFRLQSAETAVPSPSISERLGLGADLRALMMLLFVQ